MTRPNFPEIFQFVFDLFEPIYFEQSNHDSAAIYLIALSILLIGSIAFGFQFYNLNTQTKAQKKNFFLILILLITPISLAFAASWILPYSVWGTQHLIFAFAPFTILLAVSLSNVKIKQLKLAGITVSFLLVLAAFWLQLARPKPIYLWCAWENLALNLLVTPSGLHTESSSAPTKIYVFEDLVAYNFWFALRDSVEKFQIVKINEFAGLIEDKAYFLPRGFDSVKVQNDFQGDDFYIAFRAETWNESAPPLQNLIAKGYKIGDS